MEKILFPHIFIYDSSAGSGKTHQLALRFLHLILTKQESVKNNIQNILALTFTNKTSQEMRRRIIEWMKRITLGLSVNKHSDKKIISTVGEKVILNGKEYLPISLSEAEIKSRISKVFEHLLKNYNDFKVSTIDSFVTLILKASSFKLGMSPNFEIELNVDPYINIIIDKLFQDILEKPDIREVFDRFIENYSFLREEKANWFPKDFIKTNIKDIWSQVQKKRKNIRPDNKEMAEFDLCKKSYKAGLLKRLNTFCKELMKEKEEKKLDFKQIFIKKIEQYLAGEDVFIFKNYALKALNENLKKGSFPCSDSLACEWGNIRSELSVYFEKNAEYHFFYLAKMFGIFEKRLLEEVRYKGSKVLIPELNNLLRDILNQAEEDPDFLPELYYYLSARFDHFLIDEFQDTNYLQFDNLKILIQESLSRGGSLFVVGDRKQAIYNWRGASSDLIGKIGKMFPIENIYHHTLDINYRSEPKIIHFNNLVFDRQNLIAHLKGTDDDNEEIEKKIEEDFHNAKQKLAENRETDYAQSGYVYVKKIIRPEMAKEDLWAAVKEEFISLIHSLRERKVFRDKDICVLCRKRDDVDLIVNWLLEEKINVESDITVNIKNNLLIKEFISLLHFLDEPENNFAFINFLEGNIFQALFNKKKEMVLWYQEKLISASYKENIVLYKQFSQDYPEIWNEYFSYFFKIIGYMPSYEFILLLLKKWNVFENHGAYTPYFLKLLEIVRPVENTGNNISNFLDYFIREDVPPESFLLDTGEGADAVKVMTIHKSKGLEFPVVILPFSNIQYKTYNTFFTENENSLQMFHITKEDTLFSRNLGRIYHSSGNEKLLEELNNLYVSFTRAKNELYIFLPQGKKLTNPAIGLIYDNAEIQDNIKDDVIEIGTPAKSFKEQRAGEEEKFGEMQNTGKGLAWFELLKAKVADPAEITKNKFSAELKGNILHYILSLITEYPGKMTDEKTMRAFNKFGLLNPFLLKNEKSIALMDEINKLLKINFENKNFLEFFQLKPGDKVFSEKEIADQYGALKRIDRIITRDDKIEVLDFKTGEEYKESHSRQINEYKQLIKNIYPGKEIKAYLCYLTEASVREVL